MPSAQERDWAIFEALRAELGYADSLGALQRYRLENPHDPHGSEVRRVSEGPMYEHHGHWMAVGVI